ncbi:glycosyl transferase [Sphaerisporangium krabiense]|uniref:ADP-heptose:LPS heptosyltransferase n=1 Tax=Sphaerisporangium krabiense TaxID=763782 RepID=A0A7W8Z5Z1_9ACTN|nr:glycosyltransferase family 9 protein [Sphaerisporangium krabiense]MBB5628031.1 ADP-heptose:LPS heptosyltransferase [Sphaerisporangium krabiense]GII62196.1 glycosyl transferase [Sphaerisporangium krabiense]
MSVALVLRAPGVGELLTAVPALRALHRGGLSVVLAVPGELRDLALLSGAVGGVIPTRGHEAIAWDGRRLDLAVNMRGRGPQSHRAVMALRPRRLWAYSHPSVPWSKGPQWDEDEHEVARWCRLVTWYGSRADPSDLALPVPRARNPWPGAVVVHPGRADPAGRWPHERFAQVARELAGDGLRVVVTGSLRERPLALLVAAQAGLSPRAVLAGRTTLVELCALVAGARLVVSADTGIAHVATAYATPSVVVFCAGSPARWGPPADRPWHRVLTDPSGVPAETVVAAARELPAASVP